MKTPRIIRSLLLTVSAISALLLQPGIARAQSNLVMLISQPGDYIGQGAVDVTTNAADFSLSGAPDTVSVSAFGYSIIFQGPGQAGMTVGVYSNASRWPFNGPSPGLSVFGNGRGCNTVCGSFQIMEIHTNSLGQVDRFWVTFTHVCECFMAPMTGEIRYNSQLAPPIPIPRTLHVPADFLTIGAAISNASLLTVDTVLVSPGTYPEMVNFTGKRLHLVSTGGPSVTTIAPPSGAAVVLNSGETSDAVVCGFTLTCTTGVAIGGGSSPTVVSNVILHCGTGIDSGFSSPNILSNSILLCSGNAIHLGGAAAPLIQGNIIRTNNGGIIMFAAGSPTIRNNIFQGNNGDAMNMVNQSDADIVQNLIIQNTGNGIYWLVPSGARGPRVVNNTIYGNGASGIYADGFDIGASIINNIIVGSPALSVGGFNDNNPPATQYNDIFSTAGPAYSGLITNQTGIAGNISADPSFACLPGSDFHVLATSPCIDHGTNGAQPLLPADFDGNTRILDGDTNGSAVVDMGAFEFNPASPPSPCLYINCPGNVVVNAAPGQNSAVAVFPAPTGTPVATISCSPPSGSVFPAGTNTVTCTASYGTNSVSCSFTVTVLVSPTITSQPQSLGVPAGQSFTLTVGAAGSTPLSYRWTFEGANINGATSPSVTISNAQMINEGAYRAVIMNAVGSVTSSVVFVRIFPSVPIILTNPAPLSVPASSNASFSVTAVGSQPLAYQWLFKGAPIPGAVASQYSITDAQSGNAGNYQVIVTNGSGSATSTVALLTVTPLAPFFVTQPNDASAGAGGSITFSAQARGTEPITYQWLTNGVGMPGATQTSLTLSNLGLTDSGGFSVVASNTAGVSTSRVAQLTVFQSPSLQQPLTSQVVDFGTTVSLTVGAVGSSPLTYSWQLNNAPISGTTSNLTIPNIQPAQSGYYRVTISNPYGSISSTARISVLGPRSWVVSWGDDSGGQTDVPATLDDVVATAGGDFHSLALRHDGTLVAWGYNGDGQTTVPTNLLRFVSIASGASHNLAVTETGSVVAWGRNDFGQRNVPPSASSVLAVAAGDSYSVALLSSGTVIAWGDNSFGQVSGAANLTGIRAIASGREHSLALRNNRTVAGWGFNAYGQAAPPQTLNGVAAIAAGYLHSVALLSNNTVVAWGDNTYGQTNVPPGLSNVVAIAAGDFHTFALTADGSIIAWGDDTFGQTAVPAAAAKAFGIASGNYHGLALVPPMLRCSTLPGGMSLEWSGPGVLQWAPALTGPFNDIPGLSRGFTNYDMSSPEKYFRLRR